MQPNFPESHAGGSCGVFRTGHVRRRRRSSDSELRMTRERGEPICGTGGQDLFDAMSRELRQAATRPMPELAPVTIAILPLSD